MPIALRYLLAFVVAASLVIAGYRAFGPQRGAVPVKPVAEEEDVPQGEPMFTWVYSSLEEGEILRTKVSLRAMYFDGASRTKEIDTVDGTCNTYPSPDDDVYRKSEQIICYYAGLGNYFKIVAQDGKYLVQKRTFEEASPDYTPPVTGFETVAEF